MTLKKTISILGSTGSIGSNTIDVINSNKNKFSVLSLTSKNNVNLLSKQSFLLNPKFVAIQNKEKYKDLKHNLFGKKIKILAGDEGIIECTNNKVDIVGKKGEAFLIDTYGVHSARKVITRSRFITFIRFAKCVNKLSVVDGFLSTPTKEELNLINI